ncbi:hypothetical protein BJX63DRAFT_429444 [Aspergillus granulosus]|uniref:Yeast cell wall synthesis Kre9/Knh1-like N-terminal domain-containing protein n=1 Tax=Aspergillus granulosus TaxID=176169 RepID=A0ABR4HRK5_9EURO
MHFLELLLTTWACLAQVSFAEVAFTKWPATVYTGKPATMTWSGDVKTPATISLRQGPSDNLTTLKVLTTQAGGSYTWVPDESLPEGTDYAFQIEQNGSVNYSGHVKLAHEPGKEPKNPLPSDSLPLGGPRNTVQKGNNGHLPVLNGTSPQTNMTSSKSTTPSSDGTSFRYGSPKLLLSGLAVIMHFAA